MSIIEQACHKWESYNARLELGSDQIHINRDKENDKVRIWAGGGCASASIYLSSDAARLMAEMLVQAANKE